MVEANKLNSINPDYTGSWGGSNPSWFSLYILGRSPLIEKVYPHEGTVEEIPAGERIEGIIFDKLGLSVFSGRFNGDNISFVKTYNLAARVQGAFGDIIYQGQIQREGKITGWYNVPDTDIKGDFEMRPFSARVNTYHAVRQLELWLPGIREDNRI